MELRVPNICIMFCCTLNIQNTDFLHLYIYRSLLHTQTIRTSETTSRKHPELGVLRLIFLDRRLRTWMPPSALCKYYNVIVRWEGWGSGTRSPTSLHGFWKGSPIPTMWGDNDVLPPALILVILIVYYTVLWLLPGLRQQSQGISLPPGPKAKFLTGNLEQLPRTEPWLTFASWSKVYGKRSL